jgi:Ulp1 family protease
MTNKKYKESDFVLNFNDAVIYGSDLTLVQSRTAWLNDACINFFVECIKAQVSSRGGRNLQYMDPAVVSFFVHQCINQDEIEEFVSGLQFQSPCKIFIPINDSMVESSSWQSRGGNHWSLLVVARPSEASISFWHFDSIKHSGNMAAADTITRKLARYRFGIDAPVVVVVGAETPPQSNGYDCGVHMIEAIHVFSQTDSMDLRTHVEVLRKHVQDRPNFCHERRKAIADQIFKLANQTNTGSLFEKGDI